MIWSTRTLYTLAFALLLPLTVNAQTDSLEAVFIVEKRCHDYKIFPDIDTLYPKGYSFYRASRFAGNLANMDTAAPETGIYKFWFQQCGLNLIDSISTDIGTCSVKDSIITLKLETKSRDPRLLALSFYKRGEMQFFKTYLVASEYNPDRIIPCNCDSGNLKYYIDGLALDDLIGLSKAKIRMDTLTSGPFVAVEASNNKFCYTVVSCNVFYKYTDKKARHIVNTNLSLMSAFQDAWFSLKSEVPVNTQIEIIYKYRRSDYCADSSFSIRRDSRNRIRSSGIKRVQKKKFRLTLTK